MSIKQLLLNMSSEARQEIKDLIDWIEGKNIPEVEAKIEQVEDTDHQDAKDESTDTPID